MSINNVMSKEKMWYIYSIEYYPATKRNETELFLMIWMDLGSVIESEYGQKEKNNMVYQCIYMEYKKRYR